MVPVCSRVDEIQRRRMPAAKSSQEDRRSEGLSGLLENDVRNSADDMEVIHPLCKTVCTRTLTQVATACFLNRILQ